MIKYGQLIVVDTYANLPATAGDGDIAYCQDLKLSFVYNALSASWTPGNRMVVKKSSVVVNGSSTGVTPIYTLEQSGSTNFYPTQIIVRAVNVSGVTLKPTFSIGTNASNYDNIATGSLLNSVTNLTGITTAPQNAATSPALAGGTVISANVTTALIGTSYTFKVEVIGFYDV